MNGFCVKVEAGVQKALVEKFSVTFTLLFYHKSFFRERKFTIISQNCRIFEKRKEMNIMKIFSACRPTHHTSTIAHVNDNSICIYDDNQ